MARHLRNAGFRLKRTRTFEVNVLFDTPELRLRAAGSLLRVRQFGKEWVLTFKGPAKAGRHKSREELETQLADGENLPAILGRLGFEPVFRYEKYRTEYTDGEGIATIDETPIGDFVELEGSAAWIDAAALKLGWSAADYITKSYGKLYLDHCERRAILPSNMTF
ncbi:MAG: class IV adenylate cyclase [Bryobacterales bacterium]|nr:class IV adenylate cyclase [Bryobacterales bacterium]